MLAICSASLFTTYLDSTILNLALPTIKVQMHASLSGLQWILDSYLLVLASLLLLSGAVADRIGRRRVFSVGLACFSAGSLLCSLAPDLGVLIAFRVVQAVGGCMLVPASLSIVRHTFTDPRERAQATGLWSGVFGLAIACGPLAGGALVAVAGWRSVFWVNVPIGLAALVLTRRHVPESRAGQARRPDLAGQALIIVTLAALTYVIIQGNADGWTAPPILALAAVAVAAMAGFVLAERAHPEPLLDFRFFASAPFTGANVVALLSFTVLSGYLFVTTLYLQQAHGDSALVAGLAMLPATGAIAASAPLAGQLVARRGPRLPLAGAGVFIAAGAAVLLVLPSRASYPGLAAGYLLMGIGLGIVNPPITNTAISGMPPDQAGVASAVASTSRQVGSVLGVAVMGALLGAGPATRVPWALCLACGLVVTGVAWATTGARAAAGGARTAAAAPR